MSESSIEEMGILVSMRKSSIVSGLKLSTVKESITASINHQLNLRDTEDDAKSSSVGSIEVLEVCFQLLFALMI